ncbi:MAG: tetratricopeptide repeat protein [Rhodanobacter sp.]|nr:MAG: tetratricopeptide repeat protein [Rhodanobacter sp.]
MHQHSAATNAYEQATKLNPTKASAWFNLGLTYSIEGNRDGAIEAYQHLRKLDPAKADKLFNIAILPR